MPCHPATGAAMSSASSSIVISALEARIKTSEAAHHEAQDTIQHLREEKDELHSMIAELRATIAGLEERMEHMAELPELLKTTVLDFIRDT